MLKKCLLLVCAVVLMLCFTGNALALFRVDPAPGPLLSRSISEKPAVCFEQDKMWAKWRVKGNTVSICFNIENLDSSAQIDAYDIVIYCEDIYENKIYPSSCASDDYMLTYTIKKNLKPGKTGYSSYCKITGCEGINYVYAAVSKYHYKRGSEPCGGFLEPDSSNTVEIPESELDWRYWEID